VIAYYIEGWYSWLDNDIFSILNNDFKYFNNIIIRIPIENIYFDVLAFKQCICYFVNKISIHKYVINKSKKNYK